MPNLNDLNTCPTKFLSLKNPFSKLYTDLNAENENSNLGDELKDQQDKAEYYSLETPHHNEDNHRNSYFGETPG